MAGLRARTDGRCAEVQRGNGACLTASPLTSLCASGPAGLASEKWAPCQPGIRLSASLPASLPPRSLQRRRPPPSRTASTASSPSQTTPTPWTSPSMPSPSCASVRLPWRRATSVMWTRSCQRAAWRPRCASWTLTPIASGGQGLGGASPKLAADAAASMPGGVLGHHAPRTAGWGNTKSSHHAVMNTDFVSASPWQAQGAGHGDTHARPL